MPTRKITWQRCAADGRGLIGAAVYSECFCRVVISILLRPATIANGFRRPAVDQLLADDQMTDPGAAGNVLWPLTDHLGTVRDLASRTVGNGVFVASALRTARS